MKINTVLILAGGDGDRFYPLEQKVRFPFNGKTTLQHIVDGVAELAEHVVVVTSEANEQAIKSDLSAYKVEFVTQTHDEGGMADAVLAAKKYMTKDVIILNGNDAFDFSVLTEIISNTNDAGCKLGIIAKHMDTYFPGGYVRFEGERAGEIIEKPAPENRPSDYVKMVADYLAEGTDFMGELAKLPSTDDQYEKALSVLMKNGGAACTKYTGPWATLKFSWHVLAMQEYFFAHLQGKLIEPTALVHTTATIEGDVCIGKNVTIGAYCKITGPCYIADNAVVGDHSLVRSSTIGKNALVGSGCEVARSYLGEGVMLHRNYVGDSVLAKGVSMGAGAVTANYRFDAQNVKTPVKQKMIDSSRNKLGLIAGENVKIGVNSSTYPGVKLAPGTLVLPGEVVKKDK